jgi:hypothetical protein
MCQDVIKSDIFFIINYQVFNKFLNEYQFFAKLNPKDK